MSNYTYWCNQVCEVWSETDFLIILYVQLLTIKSQNIVKSVDCQQLLNVNNAPRLLISSSSTPHPLLLFFSPFSSPSLLLLSPPPLLSLLSLRSVPINTLICLAGIAGSIWVLVQNLKSWPQPLEWLAGISGFSLMNLYSPWNFMQGTIRDHYFSMLSHILNQLFFHTLHSFFKLILVNILHNMNDWDHLKCIWGVNCTTTTLKALKRDEWDEAISNICALLLHLISLNIMVLDFAFCCLILT